MMTRSRNKWALGCILLLIAGTILRAKSLDHKIADTFPMAKDTAVFNQSSYGGLKTLSFNDNNVLNIASKGIVLTVKEESENTYTLLVRVKGKLILSKKHIKGISKALLDNEYLSFSVFTYVDEDGNNEGNGTIIKLSDNSIKSFPKLLKNTCNHLIMDGNIYFVDGLSLIKTDMDFKVVVGN
jgi:hypothetical protein